MTEVVISLDISLMRLGPPETPTKTSIILAPDAFQKPPGATAGNLPTCPCRAQQRANPRALAALRRDARRKARASRTLDRDSITRRGKRDRSGPDDHLARHTQAELLLPRRAATHR